MKKINLLAITAFAVLSFTSCKKDRTCTCTQSQTSTLAGSTAQPAVTFTAVIKKSKKEDAAYLCTTKDVSTSNGTDYSTGSPIAYVQTTTTTCTLK